MRATPPPTFPAPRTATRTGPALPTKVEGGAVVGGEPLELSGRHHDFRANRIAGFLQRPAIRAGGHGTSSGILHRTGLFCPDFDDVEAAIGFDDVAGGADSLNEDCVFEFLVEGAPGDPANFTGLAFR